MTQPLCMTCCAATRAESWYCCLAAASGVPESSAPAIVRYTLERRPQAENAVGRPRSELEYVCDAKSGGNSWVAALRSFTIAGYTCSIATRGASPNVPLGT